MFPDNWRTMICLPEHRVVNGMIHCTGLNICNMKGSSACPLYPATTNVERKLEVS